MLMDKHEFIRTPSPARGKKNIAETNDTKQ